MIIRCSEQLAGDEFWNRRSTHVLHNVYFERRQLSSSALNCLYLKFSFYRRFFLLTSVQYIVKIEEMHMFFTTSQRVFRKQIITIYVYVQLTLLFKIFFYRRFFLKLQLQYIVKTRMTSKTYIFFCFQRALGKAS